MGVRRLCRQCRHRGCARGDGIPLIRIRVDQRALRRQELRRDARRLDPRTGRIGQAPELQQHLTQVEVSVREMPIAADRAAIAQHRIDDPALSLMLAPAAEPLQILGACHQRNLARNRASSDAGSRRAIVRPGGSIRRR